ncbi:hypothetical protein ABPG72_003676 [Tetrahymena utriculariae]
MAEEIKKQEEVLEMNNPQEEEGEPYSCLEEYFVDCCRYNDLEEAKDCIQQGCDITWFDNSLNNAIHMACANGHIQVLMLIKEELDKWENQEEKKQKFINHKNCDQNTALHWAAINGQKEVIVYMIETLKADPNICNSLKKTPFDEAVVFNQKECAEILAKVTKEDMSIYEGLEDYTSNEEVKKEETMSDS